MKTYTDKALLDIVDAMPVEKKQCTITDNEDGSKSIVVAEFILNFARALLDDLRTTEEPVHKPRKPRTRKKDTE